MNLEDHSKKQTTSDSLRPSYNTFLIVRSTKIIFQFTRLPWRVEFKPILKVPKLKSVFVPNVTPLGPS